MLKKHFIAILATTILAVSASSVIALPAYAAPAGDITIGSGTEAGWSYSAGVIETTASGAIINPATLQGYLSASDPNSEIIVSATQINFNSNISSTSAKPFTLRATGNIIVADGVNIQTTGGDVTFQSDSDNTNSGSIRFGNTGVSSTGGIDTNGGRILLSGGANPLTGYAKASSDRSGSKPYAGIAGYGFNFQADGGDIIIRGTSYIGSTTSTRAVMFESNNAGRQIIQTSGVGNITISAPSNSSSTAYAGLNMSGANITSGDGMISLSGSTTANGRGVSIFNVSITSTSGNISINDTTSGATTSSDGMYVGNDISMSTGGTILIKADEFTNGTPTGTPLTFSAQAVAIKAYTGTSFGSTSLVTTGYMNLTNCLDFTLGESGNTGALTISQPLSSGGPMTFNGANIAINAALTASNSTIYLNSSGTVSQTAAIVAGSLGLSGSNAVFTLNNSSNNVSTIAGGSSSAKLGNVTYVDAAGGLTIGAVGSLSGFNSSGVVNISTLAANLTLAQPVSSTYPGDSIKLYADQDASSGSAGDGNIVVQGNGSVTTDASGRALLYSGVRGASTGLVDLVGGESNTRSLVDATTTLSSISPALGSTGQYALFRTNTPSPTYTITYDGNQNTGGSAPSSTSSTGAQTLPSNSGNLARTGYTFSGWNTQADGNGTTYAAGSSYTPGANVTLYAKWTATPSPSYTITYDGNQNTGGSAPSSTSSTGAQTLPSNSGNLARTGYTFSGWNTQADGNGTTYAAGSSYTPGANVTLYAKWAVAVSPAALPHTGFSITGSLAAAVSLFLLGMVFLARARKRS